VCSEDGRVRELRMPENSLSGTLPPEVGELTHLTKLSLYYNSLSGTLPTARETFGPRSKA